MIQSRPRKVKKYFYRSGNFYKNIYWENTDYLVTVISGKEATENTSLIVKFWYSCSSCKIALLTNQFLVNSKILFLLGSKNVKFTRQFTTVNCRKDPRTNTILRNLDTRLRWELMHKSACWVFKDFALLRRVLISTRELFWVVLHHLAGC